MSQHNNRVPRLNLAPKLKRPLLLWNPLDYLRLLYWVLFFPQALRWYEDRFGGNLIIQKKINWRKSLELLRQNAIKRQLLLQGLVLIVVIPVAAGVIFRQIGIVIHWFDVWRNVAEGVLVSVILGMGLDVTFSVAGGVAFSVAGAIAFGVASDVASDVAVSIGNRAMSLVVYLLIRGVAVGVASGVGLGAAFGVALSVGNHVTNEEANDEVLEAANFIDITPFFVVVLVGWPLVSLVANLRAGDVAAIVEGLALVVIIVAGLVAGLVAILRPDNWFLGLPLALRSPRNGRWQLPHVTPLPIPSLDSRLTNWLRQDWETGLYNANQLLTYTLQFIPVIQAVNRVLAETPPAQILSRVAQLAEKPHHTRLVYSASATLGETIKLFKDTETRLDTPGRAAAAGFWYLYKKKPDKAVEAFAVVRSLPYGKEMFTLATTLAAFNNAKDPVAIATLEVLASPQEPLLRPTTWGAIASLHRVVEDVQVVHRSVSRSTRSFALNRALGKLKDIIDKADALPEAERRLIVEIAQTWKEYLLKQASEVGEISISKPVPNPYIVGDPVQGNLFVGRDEVIRQLEELWIMGLHLQSVVLYGHRRMGKTSILLNAANCLGAGVEVAYVNLLGLGDSPQGVGEVLMAISDAISEVVDLSPPVDADLLNLPYRTFERYLKQVVANLGGGLIIALDEFEKIEELIEAGKIHKDFMGFLRGLVQMSSKVAFAFAGLHTLEEMTADYFQPFFASVIPIHVGFLGLGATRQILANPAEEFPLNYTSEALDQISSLTAGQPYLVQLVGFQLVRRYNDQVFKMGRRRDPIFTVEDVEAVINDPEFFKRGRYYFTGVWGQASQGASGQQEVLKAISPHPEGLSLDAIAQTTNIDTTTLQEALKTLQRHDVIEETDKRSRIIVELFRRWVLENL